MYASNRIAVQLILLLALVAGCDSAKHASVPVSIETKPPYSYQGRVGRIWGGDNFEVVDNGKLHYAFIRGIDCPEPGQPFYDEAKQKLRDVCAYRVAKVEVVDRDQWKREVCELTAMDASTGEVTELALELLKSGLAWFDQSDVPRSEAYRQAELDAREKKIGIWSQPNPIPPWEFWEKSLDQINGQ